MRTHMKTFAALLIITSFALAGEREVDTKQITDNFMAGLTHENAGVVESTIRVVILMKIEYPEADYSDIVDELEELVMEGNNKNIRLKALIATDYLNNFEQYQWLKETNYSEGDQVFDVYLTRMSFNRVAATK